MSYERDKDALRKQMREKRDRLSPRQIHQQMEQCMERLTQFPEYQKHEWIYAYMAIGSEVDTISMISEFIKQGKKTAIPKVEEDEIVFYEIQTIKDCKPGAWGILEPASYKAPAEEPGLVLLPGLAFDKKGGRLGYGGGYYDKYLKTHTGNVSAALAYEMQILEKVPCEEHDKPVDYIITPERIITCR